MKASRAKVAASMDTISIETGMNHETRGGVHRSDVPCDASPRPKAVVIPFERRSLTRTPSETALGAAAFADLVERIASHADRAAFTRLFAYYAPRVKGYLMRLGLAPNESEEVCQEVMVAVWRKAASFDRRQASVATWIFRIARNRRIDAFRRDQRSTLDIHDPAFQPEPEAAPDAAAETVQREARLRAAMAELPPEQRDLVRVAFYEDLSHSQVAERTLDGIRNGLNDVHADERAEAIWQAARSDPAGLHAQMQQQWDERGT